MARRGDAGVGSGKATGASVEILQSGMGLREAAGAVICLHGRGAAASDILKLGDKFQLSGLAYIAPEAAGQSWYPASFLQPLELNQPALETALGQIEEILRSITAAGIARNQVALAGFSQGACLACEFAARHPARYGGVLAFTGGLMGPPGTAWNFAGDLGGTPVFLGAGDQDPHVPWRRVEETAAVMKRMGGAVELRCYPGLPHVIHPDEIECGRRILEQMPANS